MELNDARRFLNQASYFDLQIRTRMEELEKLEKMAGAGEHAQKIEGLREEIQRDLDSLVAQKQEIMQRIGQLSKPEYQTVLELRYLRRWTWNRIAMNLHICERHARRLAKEAFQEISEN